MPIPLPENIDKILGAVKTPLNLGALTILVLSGLALALFKNNSPEIKIVSFVLMAGSALIIIFAFIPDKRSKPTTDNNDSSTQSTTGTSIAPSGSESDSLANAKSLKKQADDFYFQGRHDQAREAFFQAAHLYESIDMHDWKEKALKEGRAIKD
jgi:hypothetical protein